MTRRSCSSRRSLSCQNDSNRSVLSDCIGAEAPTPFGMGNLYYDKGGLSNEVNDTAEPDRRAAIETGPHQQELGAEVGRARAAIRVPVRAQGLIVRSALENAKARAPIAA